MSACKRDFNETRYFFFFFFFLIKEEELLEKHYEICKKVSNSIKKRFDSEPTYN